MAHGPGRRQTDPPHHLPRNVSNQDNGKALASDLAQIEEAMVQRALDESISPSTDQQAAKDPSLSQALAESMRAVASDADRRDAAGKLSKEDWIQIAQAQNIEIENPETVSVQEIQAFLESKQSAQNESAKRAELAELEAQQLDRSITDSTLMNLKRELASGIVTPIDNQTLLTILKGDHSQLTIGDKSFLQVDAHGDNNCALYSIYGVPIKDPVKGFQLNTPTSTQALDTGHGGPRRERLRQAIHEKVTSYPSLESSDTLSFLKATPEISIDDFNDTSKTIDELHLRLLAEVEDITLTVHFESRPDPNQAPLYNSPNPGRPHIHLLYKEPREGYNQGHYQRMIPIQENQPSRL